MKIYHGSAVVVENPEIRQSDRFLDFGYGFYTTTSFEQARKWANKIQLRNAVDSSFVSEYEFDYEKAKKDLRIIEFKGATKEWLSFVCKNRSGQTDELYDVVIGPVADDNVYQVVKLFEMGAYDEVETIKRLKIEKLFDQILFHTEKSLTYLKYISQNEER